MYEEKDVFCMKTDILYVKKGCFLFEEWDDGGDITPPPPRQSNFLWFLISGSQLSLTFCSAAKM